MAFAAGLRRVYRSAVHQAWRYNSAWTAASKAAADAAARRCATAPSHQGAFKQLNQKRQSVHAAIKARFRLQPSVLDFSPRLHYRRSDGTLTRTAAAAQHHRAKLRLLLLEAYVGRSLRHTPQSCPAHGRARTSPFCGGTGGHGTWRELRFHRRRAHHHHHQRMRMHRTRERPCPLELGTWFLDRQLDRGCRKIRQLRRLAPIASDCPQSNSNPNHDHNSTGPRRSSHHRAQSFPPINNSGFLRPRAPQPRNGGTLLAGSSLPSSHSFVNASPGLHLGIGRLFSTSSCKKGPEVLIKAALLLKSANALQWINVLFRISVSFIPLSIKRASWARKARLAQLATGAAIATPYWATFFKYVCRGALTLPFVLLVAVLLAAIERTPITGRLRLLLLNPEEEHDIVQKVLDIGAFDDAASSTRGQRDWLSIMRAVLGEENAPEGTLLGGKVLDPSDWRVSLVDKVLRKLEHGIPALNFAKAECSLEIQPPMLNYPLKNSARCSHLSNRNAVLVIDRPESNAFSFGFYGSIDEPQPGVIIVFTGAIDEIMSSGAHSEIGKAAAALPRTLTENISSEGVRDPSWLRSFFGAIVSPAHPVPAHHNSHSCMVSQEQEEGLAVLLAHELAHLVLSHTIESYANTALLWPQLEKLGWDMLRVFIYPVTAIFGPFVQDAIAATVKVGIEESAEGRGLLPALTSSCESKKLEFEADGVALRLLANANIDPRSAIHFWEHRLCAQRNSHAGTHAHGQSPSNGEVTHMHDEIKHMHETRSKDQADTHSFIKTHPADQERITAIKNQLASWLPSTTVKLSTA